jgi:hypothetical protein
MAIWDMRSCRHFSQAIGSRIVRALSLVNLGFVKALDESSAIVGGLRFQEDPLNSKKQVASPELGYVLALDKHWLFSLSASRDFLGSVGQAAFRGSVGVIYAF